MSIFDPNYQRSFLEVMGEITKERDEWRERAEKLEGKLAKFILTENYDLQRAEARTAKLREVLEWYAMSRSDLTDMTKYAEIPAFMNCMWEYGELAREALKADEVTK